MTTLPVRARPSALSIFRNRSFRLLWTAELISAIGTALTSLAASILVYRVTGTALSVGLMLKAAALTGVPRTANVVAEQPTTLLQVTAATLRHMMNDGQLHRLFLSRMTERMVRMGMIDLPRFAGVDQASLRELRRPDPEPAVTAQAEPATV